MPDDRERGIGAYWTLDYDTAIELLTPLAESGDAEAAYYLGLMYDPVSQHVSGFTAKYHTDYYDLSRALAWYEAAIDRGYTPALVRGSFLDSIRPLDRELTHQSNEHFAYQSWNSGSWSNGAAQSTSTFASRLNSGYAETHQYQREAYRVWRKDFSNLSPDEMFLFLRVVLLSKRRSNYISRVESIEPMLEACGVGGDNLCNYYLGLIQLDAAQNTYSGFDHKYLDAWVNFALAEQMGNRHAAVHRYVVGQVLSDEEKETVQLMLSSKDR